jgi:hypothetical protein
MANCGVYRRAGPPGPASGRPDGKLRPDPVANPPHGCYGWQLMKHLMVCIPIVAGLAVDVACAQFGVPWRHVPHITVVSAAGDSRLSAVDEAIAFWNRTLAEIGSGFRLGSRTRVVRPIPEDALQALSADVLGGRGRPANVPPALRDLPGDITIVLAESTFISFTGPFDENSKRVVGIRGAGSPPMNLPNVPRNVIAHELGHAIGLGHNSDPTTLMCGRPASCRPDLFRSDRPHMFALTEDEKHRLLSMYPPR